MTIEAKDQGNRIMLSGVVDRLPDDLLMTQMDSVEESNSQAYLTILVVEVLGGMNNLHLAGILIAPVSLRCWSKVNKDKASSISIGDVEASNFHRVIKNNDNPFTQTCVIINHGNSRFDH